MKLFIFALLLTGCTSHTQLKLLTEEVAEYGVNRFENKEAICFVYRDNDGNSISCIPKVKQ